MNLGALHIMRPEWLWALLPVALAAVALGLARRRAGSWSSVISPALLPYLVREETVSSGRGALPWLVLAWVLAVIATAGPSLQKIPQPVQQREDALVILLDLSYSMKAGDLAPSRVDRARQKIQDLLQRREEGQTGLVAYAGDAHVVAPLTDDNPTIANLLPALNPDMMPVPGSDPGHAVELALDLLQSGGARDGRILLLTDAVGREEQESIADAVREAGVELVIMGVGTRNGAPLPLPGGGFLKDDQGAIVIPPLDEASLQRLARRAGGRYLPMQIDAGDLEALSQPNLRPGQERLSDAERRADHWQDQGYLLVLLLLPLAAVLFRRGLLVSLLPLLLLAEPRSAQAQTWEDLWLTPDQQGRQALEQGDAERARGLFENPAWAGTAAYESGDYEAAARRFGEGDSADDWYNRGNALARAGDLEGAIDAYRKSLERAPGRSDARDNLELVKQLQEQQKQQEQQEKNQQQQDRQNKNSDKNKKDGKDGKDGKDNQSGSSEKDGKSPQDQQAQNSQQSGEQQNPQQQPGDTEQSPGEQQPPGSEASGGEQSQQEQAPRQASPGERGEEESRDDAQQAARAQQSPEQSERDQAMEQWLRRVPDDPSGLLREKFRFESRQRQQQGEEPDDDTYW